MDGDDEVLMDFGSPEARLNYLMGQKKYGLLKTEEEMELADFFRRAVIPKIRDKIPAAAQNDFDMLERQWFAISKVGKERSLKPDLQEYITLKSGAKLGGGSAETTGKVKLEMTHEDALSQLDRRIQDRYGVPEEVGGSAQSVGSLNRGLEGLVDYLSDPVSMAMMPGKSLLKGQGKRFLRGAAGWETMGLSEIQQLSRLAAKSAAKHPIKTAVGTGIVTGLYSNMFEGEDMLPEIEAYHPDEEGQLSAWAKGAMAGAGTLGAIALGRKYGWRVPPEYLKRLKPGVPLEGARGISASKGLFGRLTEEKGLMAGAEPMSRFYSFPGGAAGNRPAAGLLPEASPRTTTSPSVLEGTEAGGPPSRPPEPSLWETIEASRELEPQTIGFNPSTLVFDDTGNIMKYMDIPINQEIPKTKPMMQPTYERMAPEIIPGRMGDIPEPSSLPGGAPPKTSDAAMAAIADAKKPSIEQVNTVIVRPPDPVLDVGASDVPRTKMALGNNTFLFDLDDVKVDPKRFQPRHADGTTGIKRENIEGILNDFDPKQWTAPRIGRIAEDPDNLYLLDGHHRLEVARRQGKTSLNMDVIPFDTFDQAELWTKKNAIAGKTHTPSESGANFRFIMEREGKSISDLAKTSALPPTKVKQMVEISYLSKDLQQYIDNNVVSLDRAAAFARGVKDYGIQPAAQNALFLKYMIGDNAVLNTSGKIEAFFKYLAKDDIDSVIKIADRSTAPATSEQAVLFKTVADKVTSALNLTLTKIAVFENSRKKAVGFVNMISKLEKAGKPIPQPIKQGAEAIKQFGKEIESEVNLIKAQLKLEGAHKAGFALNIKEAKDLLAKAGDNGKLFSVMGMLAGVQVDEDGNVNYDPQIGMLGMLAAGSLLMARGKNLRIIEQGNLFGKPDKMLRS